MKKSELRKYISEALTPDEASKVEPKYKETYAAMIRGKGPLKLKKYDNPDKVVRGRVINNLKESTRRTNEKLDIAIKEVFSEKQRKYMCVMAQPGAKRPKGLSKADAKEMCADTNISKAKQEEQTLEEIDNLMNETGQEIAKKNMDDYKRLNELVKTALMGPISEKQASTDKYDDNPALKGKQSELPDGLQKSIIKKAGGKVDENIYNAMSGTYVDPSDDYKEYKAKELKLNKTTEDIRGVIAKMSDAYMALGKELQSNTNPKVARYMNGMAEEIKDLKRMLKGMTNESLDEDVVKGSNIKKVGDKYRVLSGKTGKMWKQKYDSKKDAEAALRGYFASQNESLSERILKELRG